MEKIALWIILCSMLVAMLSLILVKFIASIGRARTKNIKPKEEIFVTNGADLALDDECKITEDEHFTSQNC